MDGTSGVCAAPMKYWLVVERSSGALSRCVQKKHLEIILFILIHRYVVGLLYPETRNGLYNTVSLTLYPVRYYNGEWGRVGPSPRHCRSQSVERQTVC